MAMYAIVILPCNSDVCNKPVQTCTVHFVQMYFLYRLTLSYTMFYIMPEAAVTGTFKN